MCAVSLWVSVDDWSRSTLNWLSKQWRRFTFVWALESYMRRNEPWVSMCIFLAPTVLTMPLTVMGVMWWVSGNALGGAFVAVTSKGLSSVVTLLILTLGRSELVKIRWFRNVLFVLEAAAKRLAATKPYRLIQLKRRQKHRRELRTQGLSEGLEKRGPPLVAAPTEKEMPEVLTLN